MATLELQGIDKSFGSVQVIRDMNLRVNDGELIVFVSGICTQARWRG